MWPYNQHCIPILGKKHLLALGRPIADVWPEAWSDLGPLVEGVYGGATVYLDDITLLLERHERPEEAHFTFSYNPGFDVLARRERPFCHLHQND